MSIVVKIPVFGKSLEGKFFDSRLPNPGCGGTQFLSIILALELARDNPNWKVFLVSDVQVSLPSHLPNFALEIMQKKELLCQFSTRNQGADLDSKIWLLPSRLFSSQEMQAIKGNGHKLVAWLHHPFDTNLLEIQSEIEQFVSIGRYQYRSNDILFKKHCYIRNLFFIPDDWRVTNTQQVNLKQIRIVYLGALVPGKGFDVRADYWKEIVSAFPNAKLDVIGSSETYTGQAPSHRSLPCDREFGDLIERKLKSALHTSEVVFHGNLGASKKDVIAKATFAILNPTGDTEAFPASPLECMSLGVPVIASRDFGMGDVMQYFPELSIDHPKFIVSKLLSVTKDTDRYNELSKRARNVAEFFERQNGEVLLRWRRLIVHLTRDCNLDDKEKIDLRFRAEVRLYWRAVRAIFVARIRRTKRKLLGIEAISAICRILMKGN